MFIPVRLAQSVLVPDKLKKALRHLHCPWSMSLGSGVPVVMQVALSPQSASKVQARENEVVSLQLQEERVVAYLLLGLVHPTL